MADLKILSPEAEKNAAPVKGGAKGAKEPEPSAEAMAFHAVAEHLAKRYRHADETPDVDVGVKRSDMGFKDEDYE